MVHNCIVTNCKYRKRKNIIKGIVFHSFPVDPLRLAKWQTAVAKHCPRPINITRHSKICQFHFLDSDYVQTKDGCNTAQTNGPNNGEEKQLECIQPANVNRRNTRHLKTTAVPSIFVDCLLEGDQEETNKSAGLMYLRSGSTHLARFNGDILQSKLVNHLLNIHNEHNIHNMFAATGSQSQCLLATVGNTPTTSPEPLKSFQGSVFAIRENEFCPSSHATSQHNQNGNFVPNNHDLTNAFYNCETQVVNGGYTTTPSPRDYHISGDDQNSANASCKQRRKPLMLEALSSQRNISSTSVYGERSANEIENSQCEKKETNSGHRLVDQLNEECSNSSNVANGFDCHQIDINMDFHEVTRKRRRPNLLEAIDNLRNMRAHDSKSSIMPVNDYSNDESRHQNLVFPIGIPHQPALNSVHRNRKSVSGGNNCSDYGSDPINLIDFQNDVTRINMESSIINDALLRVKNVGIQNCGTRTQHEFQLYYLLNKANLIHYYNALMDAGGDDLIQLCQLSKKDLHELIMLIGMHEKPFHVKRFKKIISRLRLKLRLIRSKETDMSDDDECSTFAIKTEKHLDGYSDTLSKVHPSRPSYSSGVSSTASTPGIVSNGDPNLYAIIACNDGCEQGLLGNEQLISRYERDADRARNVEMIIRDVLSSDTNQVYRRTWFSGYEVLANECKAVCEESPPDVGMMLGAGCVTLRQSIASITYNLFPIDTMDEIKARRMNEIAVQLCIRRPNLLTRKPTLVELTNETFERIQVFDNTQLTCSDEITRAADMVFDGDLKVKGELFTNDDILDVTENAIGCHSTNSFIIADSENQRASF